jgi:hypothetical protein
VTVAVADILPSLAASQPISGPVARDDPRAAALVAAARAGDREAFGELVVMHERVVFRTALAALGAAKMRRTPHRRRSSSPGGSCRGFAAIRPSARGC